jgi:tetratricopeptide (TPR) repeat protein
LDGAPAIRQALVRTEIARKQFGAALAAIDEGLTTIDERLAASPARTPWLMRKAEVLDFAGQPAEAMDARRAALAEIDRVLALRPNAIHLVTRAEICAALGILEEAKRSIAEALSKAPHYRAAQELQARLQSQPDGE